MSTPITAPFGTWVSPITSDLIVSESIGLIDVLLDGKDIYWIEGRPQEQGRCVLVRRKPDGRMEDVNPLHPSGIAASLNVRTRVHEYGGGAAAVHKGIAYVSNFSDQRLYRLAPGKEPIPITPARPDPSQPDKTRRYADGQIDAARNLWIGVREDHIGEVDRKGGQPPSLPINALVSIDLSTGGEGRVLSEGSDFYSSARLSPDGNRLAWLSWIHPNMPWVGTELQVADFDGHSLRNSRTVAGGRNESIFQPEWSPDGRLYFVSDRSGWWNLHRVDGAEMSPVCPREAEFGQAQWQFGMSTYAFLSADEAVCTYYEKGRGQFARLDLRTGRLHSFKLKYTDYSAVRTGAGHVAFRAGSPTSPTAIIVLKGARGVPAVLRTSSTAADDPALAGYLSPPEAVEFASAGGRKAFGLYYPPKNPNYRGPEGAVPPLLVKSHGGPTSAASSTLDLRIQYWTSRGIAVVDVNYGGSTGYGRQYRNLLERAWGVVDVDDCASVVKSLADQGRADASRTAITGGSAGGFTTLACLAFRNVFRAGASHYGVSDLAALARDTHKFESRYLDWLIGPYPQDQAVYEARSPVHHAGGLSAPVIFFQGDEDKIVPPSQTEVMVNALKGKGIPVEYLLFAGEQHGFRKAENIKKALDAEFQFFSTHVLSTRGDSSVLPRASPVPALTDNNNAGIQAVFFDLGETLGTATVSGSPRRLAAFDVFPFSLNVLANLGQRGLRRGVISNTPEADTGSDINTILRSTGLLAELDEGLLIYSSDVDVTKASPEIFRLAAERAQLPPKQCLFVGEDADERAVALSAEWAVCPHPLLVEEKLAGEPLQYVRVTVPPGGNSDLIRSQPFVPQHMAGAEGNVIYGLTSRRVAARLEDGNYTVELLGEPDLPLATDLYLLRDDLAQSRGFEASESAALRAFQKQNQAERVVSFTPEGAIAAVPGDLGVDVFHFEGAKHGHNLRLAPDPLLWDMAPESALTLDFAALAAPTVPVEILGVMARIESTALHNTVKRLCGQLPLDGSTSGARIESRHILDKDQGNAKAVTQIERDLQTAGGGRLTVQLQAFTYGGRTLHNVEAELIGQSEELVLVTAHLDSTAGFEHGYDPRTGPAPGADDDASGVAGVIAVAERLSALAAVSRPQRTIRFVLFNAEEQGLIGSRAYARRSRTRNESIAAVWQMDMIGFNARPPRDWEIHAGFEQSAEVESQSLRLAELLKAVASQAVPDLPAPKIHPVDTSSGDPASGRSDHASFQAFGYAACCITENFFGPAADSNPAYHTLGDTVVDPDYMMALSRVVGAAAWFTGFSSGPKNLMQTDRILSKSPRIRKEVAMANETIDTTTSVAPADAPSGQSLPIPDGVPVVAGVSGLYEWQGTNSVPFSRGELRMDVDGRFPLMAVSGTLYRGLNQRVNWVARPLTRTMTSEGLRWSGTVSYKQGDEFLFQYTAVRIERNGQQLRVTFVGGGPDLVQDYTFLTPFFRTVEFEFDTVEGLTPVLEIDTHSHPDRPAGLPGERLHVAEVYRRAGFDARVNTPQAPIPLSGAGVNAKWSDAEMHDAMQSYWSRFADRPQWALWTFSAGLHDDGANLGGVMFDDIGPNHRQGTAIFLNSFIANVPAGDPAGAAWVERMRFWTTIHEMGHAFNLAHAWQKHLGNPWVPLASGDDLLTFMNYPFRFPGGTSAFFRRFNFRFTDDELLFLRHAPEQFVQMGNANWFDNHGFQQAANQRVNGLQLTLAVDQPNNTFQFLEPVGVTVTLSNTSEEPFLVPESPLQSERLTVVVKRQNSPARLWEPFVHYCHRNRKSVLASNESVSAPLFAAATPHGWLIAEPGIYEIQACLSLDDGDVVSNTVRVKVQIAKDRNEERVAQDFFSEDVGRVLALDGSRFLSEPNEVLERVANDHSGRNVAVHAKVALLTPRTREFKVLEFPAPDPAAVTDGHGGKITSEPAEEGAVRELTALLSRDAAGSARILGRAEYAYQAAKLADVLVEQGHPKDADRFRNYAKNAPT